MTSPTHRLLGAASGFAVAQTIGANSVEHMEIVGAALFASTLPDLDVKLGIPHRGITHWFLTALILSTGLYLGLGQVLPHYTAALFSVGLGTGYSVHIFADGCTIHGVPAFAPFYFKRTKKTKRITFPSVHFIPEFAWQHFHTGTPKRKKFLGVSRCVRCGNFAVFCTCTMAETSLRIAVTLGWAAYVWFVILQPVAYPA